ncbi:MAG: hypothetical protein CVT64_07515 [Actinobacteria bacterium HGW-Actinobacteria-4]|nr:MAG: hypothetical protein CVT64_07515 [Actinobacteria bacterium HGW-Actinobacteria-4]
MKADPLNDYVTNYVRRGYTVDSRTPTQVVLSQQRRLGLLWWVVHLIISALTGGLWLIYVFYRVLRPKLMQVVLTVDASGRVKRD